MSEDVSKEEAYASSILELSPPVDINPPYDPPEVEPLISLNAFIGFYSPQTLKLIGYIKHLKFIILVENVTPIISFIVSFPKKSISMYI
jgi:hypothetical protein